MFSFITNLFSDNNKNDADVVLYAPLSGTMVPISEVPDIVISEKIVGDGIAILPESNVIVSPIDGVITRLLDSKTAFCVKADCGIEVYITFGIDTLDLKGDGFIAKVCQGDRVNKGDSIISIDLPDVTGRVKSTITSMIVVKSSASFEVMRSATGKCQAGETPCIWINLKE